MKRTTTLLLSMLCILVMVGTVDARHHSGGKMESHGQNGMMGCGGGMKGGKMGGKGGHDGSKHGAMGAFHHWMHRVMMHHEEYNLSSEQTDRIGEFSAMHAQNAIRNKAEQRVLKIDFKQALRKKNIDMKAIEKILRKQADLHFRSQKEGVTFYTQVLGLLTPEQKEMIWDRAGTPFPYPWEKSRHHGGGHHMRGRHHDDNDRGPSESKPAAEEDNPNKT